jgi:hypothetical protein
LSFSIARRAGGAIFRSGFARREVSAGGRRPCRRTTNIKIKNKKKEIPKRAKLNRGDDIN